MVRWPQIKRAVLIDGGTEATVGLFVAIIVSALIVGSGFGQMGSDLSQRVLLHLDRAGGALGLHGEGSNPRVEPRAWVFIDLADGFCQNGSSAPRCPPKTAITDRRSLADLLRNVRSRKPSLVVLDVLTDNANDPDSDKPLRDELKQPGPPVLLSWVPTEASHSLENGLDAHLLFPPGNRDGASHARYLPALKDLDGATARYLHPVYDVALPGGRVPQLVPGIALGAALVIRAPAQAPFVYVDQYERLVAGKACPLHPDIACASYARAARIFSFPRKGPHGGSQLVLADRQPVFMRLSPSPDAVLPSLSGAVVVIGNSDPSAGDTGWSAIREVSGPEIVLNDIRQYLDTSPRDAGGIATRMALEAPFLLLGFISIFIAQLSIDHLWPPADTEPHAEWTLRRSSRHIARIVVKLLITSLLSMVFYSLWLRFGREPEGLPPDFVTPFLAILCEGFLELLHRAMNGLHLVVHKMLGGHSPAPVVETGED